VCWVDCSVLGGIALVCSVLDCSVLDGSVSAGLWCIGLWCTKSCYSVLHCGALLLAVCSTLVG
jgi:hypothetical protein